MRTSVLAAGGVALALALTACGGDDSSDNGLPGGNGNGGTFSDLSSLVASAQEETAKSSSSKFTMEMNMGGEKMTAEGEGSYSGDNPAMSMTMNVQGQAMEMLFVDNVMYMKMPEGLNPDPSKPWIKMTAEDAAAQGQDFSQMSQQSDPTKTLEQLQQAGGEIKNTQETEVNGQQATQYTIELDLSKAAGLLGGNEEAAAAIPAGTLIPVELYLNSDNLPVRVEMNMDSVAEAVGAPTGGSMVMNYTDWGAPVDIQAPPADQVGEMPSY